MLTSLLIFCALSPSVLRKQSNEPVSSSKRVRIEGVSECPRLVQVAPKWRGVLARTRRAIEAGRMFW